MPRTTPTVAVAYSVTQAPCWLMREGDEPVLLREGDSILTLRGSPVALASSPDQALVPFLECWRNQGLPELNARSRRNTPIHFSFDGTSKRPRLLTIAYILRDPGRNPLLSDLPELILLPGSAGGLLPWLPPILQLLGEEDLVRKPGYLATATHLAELVFTSFVRAGVLSASPSAAGWLRGLADARIGKALATIHSRPEYPWTASMLAAEACMSRASFARRFKDLVGQSPIGYLITWRMQIAAQMVIDGRSSVSAIVEKVGYSSETAFRKAFREHFGVAPLQYAKEERDRHLEKSPGS